MGHEDKEKKEGPYDLDELKRLSGMTYDELALAPGQPDAKGMSEARYALQVKVAREASELSRVLTNANVWLTRATVVLAFATVALLLVEVIKMVFPHIGSSRIP